MNPDTFTVKITFLSSDTGKRAPIQDEDVFVQVPLGVPLPCVGDNLALDDIPYKVVSRALILANDVEKAAFWNLLVEKAI